MEGLYWHIFKAQPTSHMCAAYVEEYDSVCNFSYLVRVGESTWQKEPLQQ